MVPNICDQCVPGAKCEKLERPRPNAEKRRAKGIMGGKVMQAQLRIAKAQVLSISLHRPKASQAPQVFNTNAHGVSVFL